MAKAFGVEIKNVQDIIDHEECLIHAGDIYLDGNKVGSWEDDYMNGPPYFEYVSEEAKKALIERADKFYDICKSDDGISYSLFKGDPDIMIGALVQLEKQEGMYDKCREKGFDTMVIIAGAYGFYNALYVRRKVDDWATRFKDELKKASEGLAREYGKPLKMKYVTSNDDFIITEKTKSFEW